MSAARNRLAPVGYVIECRGAWLRAQIRSVASVITVTGRLDQTNVEPMIGHLCRFTTLDSPVIIDVKHVDIEDNSSALERLVSTFSTQCRHRGIDWALVAEPPSHRCALPADDRHLFVRRFSSRRVAPLCQGHPRTPKDAGPRGTRVDWERAVCGVNIRQWASAHSYSGLAVPSGSLSQPPNIAPTPMTTLPISDLVRTPRGRQRRHVRPRHDFLQR